MIVKEEEKDSGSAFGQALKNQPQNFGFLQTNRLYEAKFIKKIPRQAFFDLGRFGTGVVYGAEFQNAKDIIKSLKPGDKTHVKFLGNETDEGYADLSLTQADRMKVWQEIKEIQENGESIKVKVVDANKGGLIIIISKIRAFLPVSQLSGENYQKMSENISQEDWQKLAENLKSLVGKELNVKVISVNPRSQKVIVSERETLNENTKELVSKYQIGQTVGVIVSSLTDFGIFVHFADNPQIEGLIYNSEIGYKFISHPKEAVKIGETLSAKIIDIRNNKIFLSLKALKTNPWEKIGDKFQTGQAVKGKIYKVSAFGALINLPQDIQGLLPTTAFTSADEMKKNLPIGEEKEFLIEEIKPSEQRITLKLK